MQKGILPVKPHTCVQTVQLLVPALQGRQIPHCHRKQQCGLGEHCAQQPQDLFPVHQVTINTPPQQQTAEQSAQNRPVAKCLQGNGITPEKQQRRDPIVRNQRVQQRHSQGKEHQSRQPLYKRMPAG